MDKLDNLPTVIRLINGGDKIYPGTPTQDGLNPLMILPTEKALGEVSVVAAVAHCPDLLLCQGAHPLISTVAGSVGCYCYWSP